MSTNLHTHSIYVYNAQRNYIYTTSNLDSELAYNFIDQGAMDLLSGSADHRRLAPIPRYVQIGSRTIPIYSFVFYNIQNTEPRISGALIMNITMDWLREAFQDTQDSNSQIIFVDTEGTVAYHSDSSLFLQSISDQKIFQKMVESDQGSGYFLHEYQGIKSFVFYSKSQDSPLYLMRIFPYTVIMEGILDMRTTTFLLILLSVVIALLLGFLASRRLYKPINQLVSRVESENKSLLTEQGDLRFLSSSIDKMLIQVQTTESYRKMLQVDILEEIIFGKAGSPQLVEQQFIEYKLPFSLDRPLELIALKPCDESVVQKIAAFDTSCELYSFSFEGERTLILMQDCLDPQLQKLKEASFEVGVMCTIVCRNIEHPYQLGSYAARLLEELRFSFLHPQKATLDFHDLNRSLLGGTYPSELEKHILRLLHQGRSAEASYVYQEFFEQVSKNSFTHFRFSMKRLYISIQLLIKELQETDCFADYQEMGIVQFEAYIDHLETKAELDTLFVSWFEEFEEELQRCKAARNQTIIEKIKAIIEVEYGNPNLCLQFLADAVQLSVSYVSKLFKEIEGVSLSDYCLERRMKEAVRLLDETDVLVKEIASLVGFTNENYFFTVFKKNYGVTPNEYRKEVRL